MKADRKLLARVVTAMKAGRDLDVKKMWSKGSVQFHFHWQCQMALCAFPKTKLILSNIFQQDLPQNDVPRPMPTCAVIDGMAMIQP
jgi:hypothetical protein